MSKTFFKLSTGNLTQNWSDTALLNTTNVWANVPSIMGYRGDAVVSGTGKDPRLAVNDSLVENIIVNQTNPNTLTTGGVAEFHIADPVVALQGSTTANAPSLVLYLDSTGTENVHLSLDLRDIDGSADNAIQQVAVQYRIGDSGLWVTIPGAYVADASSGPGLATLLTHLDVDLPSAANNQAMLEIRIITTDAAGSDEWIGIDNIVVSSRAAAADTSAPVIASAVPADGGANVAANAALQVTFSEAVTLGSGNITLTDGAGDVRTISVSDSSQVTLSGQVLTVRPAAELHLGATYHLTLPSGAVLDLAGNAFAGNASNPVDFATALPLTGIYAIQGAAHTSPLVGQTVHTRGVVTAIDTSGTKGFWIQDMAGDGNDATSDGVFVASSTLGATVKVGDLLDLQGVVEENAGTNANNLTITQLNTVSNLSIVSRGNVIAPTILGQGGRVAPTDTVDSDHFAAFNPTQDGVDFYESLEGMLITAKNVQVVANSVSGATFVVVENGALATNANDRGGLTHTATDINPERFQLYADTGVTTGISGVYSTGDKLGDVTGVLSYFGGNYELLPTVLPNAAVHNTAARETTSLAGDATHVSIGAYNLNSLSANDGQAKYDALAHDIVANLGNPDLLGLEGVQDSNGSASGELGADITIGRLIDAIVAAGGPRYDFAQSDPADENISGGALNTNPRSVVLYNANRVQYVEESARLLADSSASDGDSFANGVHPLAADFVFRGETITYIGVDNYSRAGGDELYGKNQPATIIGDVRRADQIASVRDFVNELQAAHPDQHVVVAGNFNAFQFDNAMNDLASSTGLTNLVKGLSTTDQYSSGLSGNNEQLDHLLVSSKLAGQAQIDNVHLNTNQAANSTPTDRDPVLATVYINSAPVAVADAFDTNEDNALAVSAVQGLLANDKDINGDSLSVSLVNGPAHGSLSLNADGSFNYLPQANYNGQDSFSYQIDDGHGLHSAPTSVQLTVAAVNDAPSLTADAPSALLVEQSWDSAGVMDAVVHLQTADIDSSVLVLGNDGWIAQGDGLYSRDGLYGSVVLDINAKTLSYQLDNSLAATEALAAGMLVHEQFTVSLSDGASVVSLPVQFDIQGGNDSPYGKVDRATVLEDAGLLINVLSNDGDIDADTLGIVLLNGSSMLGASLSVENGQVRYTADADAFDLLAPGKSVLDRFSYQVNDGHGGLSAPISVQVTVREAGDSQSLAGGNGDDVFNDVAGKDTSYSGGNGNDKINGNDGADILVGGNGDDTIDGGSGIDTITGDNGNDNLSGGDGNDSLDGGNGNDIMNGGNGDDSLDGGNGDDIMQGGAGADALVGGSGNDVMVGGAGNDLFNGGSGNDVYVFGAQSGRDTILDFRPGEDTIATAYTGAGAQANLAAWASAVRNSAIGAPASAWGFADFDSDGNGKADSVVISGGNLGTDTIVLSNWTLVDLIAQHYLNGQNQVIGNWLH